MTFTHAAPHVFEARTMGDRLNGRCECGMVPGMKHFRSGCAFARGGAGEARSLATVHEKGIGEGTRTGNGAGADVRSSR